MSKLVIDLVKPGYSVEVQVDWTKLCVSDLYYKDSREPRKLVMVVNLLGSRMTKETKTWAYI